MSRKKDDLFSDLPSLKKDLDEPDEDTLFDDMLSLEDDLEREDRVLGTKEEINHNKKDEEDLFDNMLSIEDDLKSEEINIATQMEISIGDLAQKIINTINPEAKVVLDGKRVRPGKSEVERLYGSNEKLKKLTGWIPEYTIEKGLDETLAWFKEENNLKQYKAEFYNV